MLRRASSKETWELHAMSGKFDKKTPGTCISDEKMYSKLMLKNIRWPWPAHRCYYENATAHFVSVARVLRTVTMRVKIDG